MFCTGVHKCIFMINTTNDYFLEEIHFDSKFFYSDCLPKLAQFYFLCLLPEIVLKNKSENKEILDLRK